MQKYLDKIKGFFTTEILKYGTFLLGCTVAGILIFEGMLGLPVFFTVLFTVIGTQFALRFLGKLVIGMDYSMTKEKKL